MVVYKEGEEVYYKGMFKKLKKCKIVKVISYTGIAWESGARAFTMYKYVVRFKNGKEKLVDSTKIL